MSGLFLIFVDIVFFRRLISKQNLQKLPKPPPQPPSKPHFRLMVDDFQNTDYSDNIIQIRYLFLSLIGMVSTMYIYIYI